MLSKRLALLATIPVLWGALAFAQSAAGDQPAADDGMHHHRFDRAAWHKEMCTNRYAHLAGALAFAEAKLNLTDTQRPAWDAWEKARMEDAAKQRDACLAVAPPADGKRPTLLDREAKLEKHLADRLAGLQARHAQLVALYNALTPEQQAVMDRLGRSHRHGMHGWHHMMGPMGGPGPKPGDGN